MWCKSCNLETNEDRCPICGIETVEDVPVEKSIQILDERFLASPHFALEQCKTAAGDMAEYAREALLLGMGLVTEFHPEQAKRVENLENLVDSYEDSLQLT